MKRVSVVVIGFGDRAVAYTKYALNNPDRLEVKAVIDPNPFRRSLAKEMFSIPDEMLFEKMEDCLKLGKIADAVINATMDELHIPTAIPFLELGYDMLLEKPITNNKEAEEESLQDPKVPLQLQIDPYSVCVGTRKLNFPCGQKD